MVSRENGAMGSHLCVDISEVGFNPYPPPLAQVYGLFANLRRCAFVEILCLQCCDRINRRFRVIGWCSGGVNVASLFYYSTILGGTPSTVRSCIKQHWNR